MSEKVRLPKDVCDALDDVKKSCNNWFILRTTEDEEWHPKYSVLNYQDVDTIMRALVLGYEPELSAEQRLEELYWNPVDVEEFEIEAHRKAIQDVFEIQGIHYDWLEDDAE
jgi:hypothetical protein